MGQTCSRCSRVNPAEAAYCYFDGAILGGGNGANGGPLNVGAQQFANQFVFPTGQVCRNFDQLALTCQQNWKAAIDVLQGGYLESFLGGMGRSDLAQAARDAAKFPDRDRGLDQFIAKLPSDVVQPPKLAVEPTEVNLGQLKPGEDRKFELHLNNQGMRLVYGSVACEDSVWLAVGDGQGAQQKLFQFGAKLVIPVHVRGKHLRASNKPIQGKLVVDSNGGTFTIAIKAELPVKPYAKGIFAGAKSPRQIAEKAKAHPKEAAVLFEDGSVAKWYKENGWTYPVQGPASSGLAAVQQFFEALGLTPPPKVEISHKALTLRGDVGGRLSETIEIKAQEKRPVYAHAVSSEPWLEVSRAKLNGRIASIPIAVKIPDSPGQTLKGTITVRSNGNQRFVVPVTVEVGGVARAGAITSSPGGGSFAFDKAAGGGGGGGGGGAPLIVARKQSGEGVRKAPAALLAAALLGVVLWDFFGPAKSGGGGGGRPDFGPGRTKDNVNFVYDPEPMIGISFREDNQRYGIVMLKERDPVNPDEFKKLTFSKDGTTSNVCIKLDGQENLFGQQPGQWGRDAKTKKILKGVEKVQHRHWYSTWKFTENVYVTQTVMIVPNEDTRKLDTCLVHYLIDNRDGAPHKTGLRVMMDTYIGAEDGVPFAIPGQPGLLTTKKDFDNSKDIPDFIQALEHADLSNPGTTAHMGLRLPEDIKLNADDPELEPIVRMVICRWPKNPEIRWDFTKDKFWDMNDKGKGEKNDSCVTLYWEERIMSPRTKRAMAFTYGLGRISTFDGEKNAMMALTYGGRPRPGSEFTITAWLKDAKDGQRVKLNLPTGMTFAAGNPAEQATDRGSKGLSQASWKVKVDSKAESAVYQVVGQSEGARAKLDVSVRSGAGALFD